MQNVWYGCVLGSTALTCVPCVCLGCRLWPAFAGAGAHAQTLQKLPLSLHAYATRTLTLYAYVVLHNV